MAFCQCVLEAELERSELAMAKAKPKVFRFAMPYGAYPGYTWKGQTNAQTVGHIRAAMAALGKVSGAKFVEEKKTSKAHIKIYFQNIANGGQYEGNGKIVFNVNFQPASAAMARAWVQHEVMHFLGYRAAPAADRWHHSTLATEVYHIAGNGTSLGSHFIAWMKTQYGV